MFRVALKSISRSAIPKTAPIAARQSLIQSTGLARSSAVVAQRTYASGGGLSRSEIESRVLDILKSFEKVNGGKLSPTATFTTDLGLDSLDAVEVVMAVEEEFGIEIPDAEADEITSVGQAIDYVAKTPDAN